MQVSSEAKGQAYLRGGTQWRPTTVAILMPLTAIPNYAVARAQAWHGLGIF